MRLLNTIIFGACVTLFASPAAFARITVSIDQTIKGELITWVDLESTDFMGMATTSEVTLNERLLLREEKTKSIRVDWRIPHMGESRIVVLSINQVYPRECEALFRVVDFTNSTSPLVTERFGNCHGDPSIRESDGKVILYFPRFQKKAEEAYVFTPQHGVKKVPVTEAIRTSQKKK